MPSSSSSGARHGLREDRAEIDILLQQLTEPPEDATELEQRLREKLNELRAFGLPLPADLVDLENALDQELTARNRTALRRM